MASLTVRAAVGAGEYADLGLLEASPDHLVQHACGDCGRIDLGARQRAAGLGTVSPSAMIKNSRLRSIMCSGAKGTSTVRNRRPVGGAPTRPRSGL